MPNILLNVMKRLISLVNAQSQMKFKAQANSLLLSYLWWIIEPFLYISLFYFIFVVILGEGGSDFFSFLICGMFPYLWFTKAVTAGSMGIWENRGLLAQKDIPKWIFPIVNVQETFYKQILAFLMMLLVILFTGNEASIWWLQIIFVVILQSVLHIAVAMLFSTFICLARDFTVLLEFIFMIVLFSSGVFWSIDSVAQSSMGDLILRINPMASLIEMYRIVLLGNTMLETQLVLNVLLISAICLLFSILILISFRKTLSRSLFS